MQFSTLVEGVRDLSHEEKLEMQKLLERSLVEDRRRDFAKSHQESLDEFREGRLEFSDDIDKLQSMLE
jgi:hypothetical protein